MKQALDTKVVCEGTTEFFVLQHKTSKKGPGAKQKEPFYNPAMELNRDLSVVVTQWSVSQCKNHVQLLDGLAASGARGVRLANEVEGDFDVTINDWDDRAFTLIQKNIQRTKLENAVASCKDLNILLAENCFHYIDIDPFGSPVYFIDAAVRTIANNGIIACTATDTATLCGVYPKVCCRRYGAQSLHSFMMHEVGLRILLGCICREAAKYDKGIEPILSYSTDYYFRLYVRIKNGKNHANKSMDAFRCIPAARAKIPDVNTNNSPEVGPLWLGHLHRKNVVELLRSNLFDKQLNTKHDIWKLLSLCEEEAGAAPFFYTTNDIASFLQVHPPKMELIFQKLRDKGFNISRTHFSHTGFKTNAPFEEIKSIYKKRKS